MSFWTYRKAVFESALPAPTKMVLLCLDYHVNANGDPVWPSLTRIMALTSLSRTTVKEHLKAAEDAGWLLSRSRHVENGRQTSNLYKLVTPDMLMQSQAAPAEFEEGEGSPADSSSGRQPTPLNCPQGKRVLVSSTKSLVPVGASEQERVCIPLNTGDEYEVDSVLTSELQSAYPATNVLAELRKMRAWCLTNPKNRKTKSGIKRFINGWLSKEQDKGGSHRGGGQKQEWLDSLIGRGEQHGHTFGGTAERVD